MVIYFKQFITNDECWHKYQFIYLYFQQQYVLHTEPRAYLPAPSSQVLQRPGGPLQRVRVGTLRQEGEVGLYYRRMPQHLNTLGWICSIWQRSHTIPLQKQKVWHEKQQSQIGRDTQNPSPFRFKRGVHTDINLQRAAIRLPMRNVIRLRSCCEDLTVLYELYIR